MEVAPHPYKQVTLRNFTQHSVDVAVVSTASLPSVGRAVGSNIVARRSVSIRRSQPACEVRERFMPLISSYPACTSYLPKCLPNAREARMTKSCRVESLPVEFLLPRTRPSSGTMPSSG